MHAYPGKTINIKKIKGNGRIEYLRKSAADGIYGEPQLSPALIYVLDIIILCKQVWPTI